MSIVTRKSILIILLSLLLLPGIAFALEQSDHPKGLPGQAQEEDASDTDNSSKALYTFEDHSTLTMSEDTIISIDNRIYPPGNNPREKLITVSYGWIRLKGMKGTEDETAFKVVTPSATAGGSDTEFLAVVDSDGKTTFIVTAGQISTLPNITRANSANPFLISAGEAQDFYPDGSHSPVRRLITNF